MKPMVIVIPSYNNRHWYQQNLGSVCAQAYDHFRALYVDDGSSDQTGALVEQFLADQAGGHRIELIRNPVRVGALANLYRMIHTCAFPSFSDEKLKRFPQYPHSLLVWGVHGDLSSRGENRLPGAGLERPGARGLYYPHRPVCRARGPG